MKNSDSAVAIEMQPSREQSNVVEGAIATENTAVIVLPADVEKGHPSMKAEAQDGGALRKPGAVRAG